MVRDAGDESRLVAGAREKEAFLPADLRQRHRSVGKQGQKLVVGELLDRFTERACTGRARRDRTGRAGGLARPDGGTAKPPRRERAGSRPASARGARAGQTFLRQSVRLPRASVAARPVAPAWSSKISRINLSCSGFMAQVSRNPFPQGLAQPFQPARHRLGGGGVAFGDFLLAQSVKIKHLDQPAARLVQLPQRRLEGLFHRPLHGTASAAVSG